MREQIALGSYPVIGFADEFVSPPSSTSPWGLAVGTSIVSAAAGWVIEEVARKIMKRRR